jgi:hypothetical protein
MAIKPNHNGAKNGGGYWGTRKEAKEISSRLRRIGDTKEIMSNYPDGMTSAHWKHLEPFGHDSKCEESHYICRMCNHIWSKAEVTAPVNQCPDCDTPCNPRYEECVCDRYEITAEDIALEKAGL